MASSRSLPPSTESELAFQKYFTALAPEYGRYTGNSTRRIISEVLEEYGSRFGIDELSLIHDNAAGPGTATDALLEWFKVRRMTSPAAIMATDSVPAMIEALAAIKSKNDNWRNVKPEVMDSQMLSFKTDNFSHCFCNFSIFTFARPLYALAEIHRTLRPKGIAVVTCWKRFGVVEVMQAAKREIKGGDGEDAVKMPGHEFLREGYLASLVEKAGWESGKIKTLEKSTVIRDGEDLKGLIDFMQGDFSKQTRTGWTDEENSKWSAAVLAAVEEEKKKYGGVRMESWVVLARKWDELSG